ncbi:NIK-and IKBKB-binding protein [Operophtera brumata]|uniref:NIK-and IKBKB-binding protein n=1 Tax=Operophtera brumata TaxID=104452 RepID=A0A0L7L2C2_OPEBR|nr:NIK-and IKBKB-binding protein [Operophtera brumata]
MCSEHITNNTALKWHLMQSDISGRASVKGITLSQTMIDIVRMSPLNWAGECLSLGVAVCNHLSRPLHKLCLSVQFYQDYNNGVLSYKLDNRVATAGNNKVVLSTLPESEKAYHECTVVFLTPGEYKIDIQCSTTEPMYEPSVKESEHPSIITPCSGEISHVWRFIPPVAISLEGTTAFRTVPSLVKELEHNSSFQCPQTSEMRLKWMKILKNRYQVLDWSRSKICSKHFEQKYFDSQRKLKDNAVPTLFASGKVEIPPRSKVDRLLNKLSQAELQSDIKTSLLRLKEPSNLDVFVNDDLKCKPDAPMEAKLWLMVKKQDNLNIRLMDLLIQTKKHVEILQNNTEESRTVQKEQEQHVESLKYIVKCLQEKHATLEEQIEILTAVESR